jgi:sialate O-acetylesterase
MPVPMVLTSILLFANAAQFGVPAFFSDHMVLQREKPVPVWGWDKPGSTVKVTLDGKTYFAVTPPDGKFRAVLPPMKAGGPYEMTVEGSGTVQIHDVYVGEVWICSGQSNMEFVERNALDRDQANLETDPHVRMFTVTKKISNTKLPDVTGRWVAAAPGAIDNFSAVGYAFARKLYRDLKVPIGMIHTSWGGTPAEAWTSIDMMSKDVMTANIAVGALDSLKNNPNAMRDYVDAVRKWEVKGVPDMFGPWNGPDPSQPTFDDGNWKGVAMPYAFPIEFDGIIWFRKQITLTADQAAKIDSISLGAIDDMDITYVNGEEVGRTDMTVPGYYMAPRHYTIKPGVLKAGQNVVAIKAYDGQGPGGFNDAAQMKLGDMSISDGWRMGSQLTKQPPLPDAGPAPQEPMTANNPNFPETLYNGMLYPLAPYAIRGALWYQGESNAGRAVQYRYLLSDMIKDWRKIFRQGDFPFYIVQLANFMKPDENQFDSAWAELRDAQDTVGLEKNNGTASIIDIGDANDIHPRDKRDVGERLARIALHKDYDQNIEWQGPRFAKATFLGPIASIELGHANGLTTSDGKEPRGFVIAGEDHKWHWGKAMIVGSSIKVSSPEVQSPVAVRYAWQDNPQVNLINSDKLPAMPFRTDTWPLTTRDNW